MKTMAQLTSEQIEELHERHTVLIAEVRAALERIEMINEVLESGEVPAADGTGFDDIGTPLKERPA
jgi:hypothetical protein